MFVRKKKNRSGTISVVVVDTSRGRFRELITIGVGGELAEIEFLCQQGRKWIETHSGKRDMFTECQMVLEEKQVVECFLSNMENILLNGTQLILNQVFRLTGFDAIDNDIPKHLVVARIIQPSSKACTVDYLKSYYNQDVDLHKIFRY